MALRSTVLRVGILVLLGACRTRDETSLVKDSEGVAGAATSSASADEDLDTDLGEAYENGSAAGESALINQIVTDTKAVMERRYPVPPVHRDVHTKSHGCLQGEFEADNALLPQALRVGVFKSQGERHKVWLRFSNNSPSPTGPDGFPPDIRGLGIKLMGVDGTKIEADEPRAKTQDFLFLAEPNFFIKTNAYYVDFLRHFANQTHGTYLAWTDFPGFKTIASDQLRTTFKYNNPLDVPYFSSVAYRLGERSNPGRQAIKYSFTRVSCSGDKERFKPFVLGVDPDYMRHALKQSMKDGPACFEMAAQIRPTDVKDSFPVEDSSVVWPTEAKATKGWSAPYIRVGSFTFPKQEFDTDARNAYCENLSFNPWHSLPEHRPLGRINRGRRIIYGQLTAYRHARNGIDRVQEPEDFDVP